ncbi:MAG: hypothetical protein WCP35_11990 [Verrucomicrobiota bacterium]
MGSSTLVLPGDFEEGKNYLLAGATLRAWRDALVNDRALPGAGLQETSLPGIGRVLHVVSSAATAATTAARSGISPFHGFLCGAGIMRIANGRLVTNPKSGALQTISGLNADIALTYPLKVALIVTMDDSSLIGGENITDASISFPDSWGDAYTYTGTAPDTYQTLAEIKIGEVFPDALPLGTPGFEFALDGLGTFYFEQYLHTHLCMALATLDGQAGQLPVAWPG